MCEGRSLVNHIGGWTYNKNRESYGQRNGLWYGELPKYGWSYCWEKTSDVFLIAE